MLRRVAVATAFSALIAACGSSPNEATTGEIDDTAIRLSADTAPADAWLDLENVGTKVCPLIAVLASEPDALPIDGQQVVTALDSGAAEPIETYVEVNGTPVDRGEVTDEGWVTDVAPGDRVRLQIAFEGIPDAGERVVLCNGAGDYAAGRFAVLRFER